MNSITFHLHPPASQAAEQAELDAIAAESIGWLPLGDGAYLHVGDPQALVITVVGVPRDGDAVLLVGW